MNLQQMRCLSELVRQGLGISAAARALNASQPAVTKQLRQLEAEVAAPLFVRERHRIVALTSMGQQVVKLAQQVCLNIDTIKRLGLESSHINYAEIRIATTHAQAKFVLPEPMQRFSECHKNVKFELRQAQPAEIVSLVSSGEVDLGITPASSPRQKDVIFLTYQSYPYIVLLPKDHPLLREKKVSLKMLASYPIITTGAGQVGRTEVISVFTANDIHPNIQLSAPDFDVIKVCVERRLGIAILPRYIYDSDRDQEIRAIDASHMFPPSVTSIVIRKKLHAPQLVYHFLNLLIPGKGAIPTSNRSRA